MTIWDRPIRLAHVALILLFAALWWTGENGVLAWHRRAGLALVFVLVFRTYWGIAGPPVARFANFVRGPRTLLASLSVPSHVPGHSPLGGASVAAMLLVLFALVATGLVANDTDGIASGPLAHLVSYAVSHAAALWHGAIFEIALALAALHVAAIAFYRFVRGRDLLTPMLPLGATLAESRAPVPRIAIGVVLASLVTALIASELRF